MKKKLALALIPLVLLSAVSGCSGNSGASGAQKVIIISKSYQNQFYQAAFKGAKDAAAKYKVELVTNGPDAESNVSQQVEQLASAVNQKPMAIALAACDPTSVQDVLSTAKDSKIPVIGFDSGVPGDKSGAVVATASTDNKVAGGNVATHLLKDTGLKKKLLAATAASPVVIGVLAQDSISGSIVQRVDGFIDTAVKGLETMPNLKGAVDVSGQQNWTKPSSSPAKVKIVVTVPPTTSQADIQSAASAALSIKGTAALFASNQDAVAGTISATNDGTDLNRTDGKFKDIVVVGFDSGKVQRDAISAQTFYGSVTQDPYQMGYQAVKLAVEAGKGKTVHDIDTGSHWYNHDNINDPDIAKLLYD